MLKYCIIVFLVASWNAFTAVLYRGNTSQLINIYCIHILTLTQGSQVSHIGRVRHTHLNKFTRSSTHMAFVTLGND